MWDVAKRVPQLVVSMDCYPLLLFHVGMNNTGSWNMGRIKGPGNSRAQAIFSSVLDERGKTEIDT